MVCVPAVEGDSFVNILSVMMNSSVNRLKRWEDNKLDFFGNSISLSGRVLDYLWQKNGMIAANKAELSVELLVQLRNKALESYDQLIKIGF